MKKICTVLGARPQFIKAATLSRLFANEELIEEILIHTGQHYDAQMSDIFFAQLQIPACKYNLNINHCTHGEMTGRMLESIEEILLDEKPNAMLVYGDTNSTLAGALAAAKLEIPIFHVESGLRSFNMHMPEEINRIVTDRLSYKLFCPTQTAVTNLSNEGIKEGVHLTGDVMYDATLFAINANKQNASCVDSILDHDYAFLTIHRAEATESKERLLQLIDYAVEFALENELKIIFAVHPRTKQLLKDQVINTEVLIMLEPMGYFETHAYLSRAKYVITDSGGLQKEAYFHRVPCITLRSETEWVETISSGWNKLWTDASYCERVAIDEYGDGNAAAKIKDIILQSDI